jgi:hypothetical protein
MVSLPKTIDIVFGGLLLSWGLALVAQTELFDRRQVSQGLLNTSAACAIL